MRRADGNILVAGNINLFPKGLVHSILDAVTTGLIRAKLDGVSVEERCDTMLLAIMDLAEAELTPHKLDRFDICVRTATCKDLGGGWKSSRGTWSTRALCAHSTNYIPSSRRCWSQDNFCKPD